MTLDVRRAPRFSAVPLSLCCHFRHWGSKNSCHWWCGLLNCSMLPSLSLQLVQFAAPDLEEYICFFKMTFRWISYHLKLNLISLKCWRSSFVNVMLNKTVNNIVLNFIFICCVDAPPPTWEQLENGLVAVRTVVHGLVDYIQNHSKKGADQQQVRESLEAQKWATVGVTSQTHTGQQGDRNILRLRLHGQHVRLAWLAASYWISLVVLCDNIEMK